MLGELKDICLESTEIMILQGLDSRIQVYYREKKKKEREVPSTCTNLKLKCNKNKAHYA